jgi:isochorismate hydrolase
MMERFFFQVRYSAGSSVAFLLDLTKAGYQQFVLLGVLAVMGKMLSHWLALQWLVQRLPALKDGT